MINELSRGTTSTGGMEKIEEEVKVSVEGLLPFLTVHASGNLMSSVTIRGTKEPREEWGNGIFHNATYFIMSITPAKGVRYYTGEPEVTVELISAGNPREMKFRKYTGPIAKVVGKIQEYVLKVKGSPE